VAWKLKREVELLNRDGTPQGRSNMQKAASSASGGNRTVKRKRGRPASHPPAEPHALVTPPREGRDGGATPVAPRQLDTQAKLFGANSVNGAVFTTRPEGSRVSSLAQSLVQTYYRNASPLSTAEALPANASEHRNKLDSLDLPREYKLLPGNSSMVSVASTATTGELSERSDSNSRHSRDRSRSGESSSGAELPLRVAADDALARLSAQLKKPLSVDEQNVLRSAEVLIWSYVATMQELSTRVLRVTADPPVPSDLSSSGGGYRPGSDGSGSTDETGDETTADGGSDNDSDYEVGKERKKSRKRGRRSRPPALGHEEPGAHGRSGKGGMMKAMDSREESLLDERSMVGKTLRKAFPPLGTFRGRVVGRGLSLAGGVKTWRIAYEDGDAEDLPWKALAPLLDPTAEWSTKAAAAAANVKAAAPSSSSTAALTAALVPPPLVIPGPEPSPATSVDSNDSDRGIKRSHSFPNESVNDGRRPRNARVRRATSFLDPHEQGERDKAAAAELAKKESAAKATVVAGEMGTPLPGGNGTAALTWKDGLVAHGYYDLVPKQLAKGLAIECGRVVKCVQWGEHGCTVTSAPLRPGGGNDNEHGSDGDDDDAEGDDTDKSEDHAGEEGNMDGEEEEEENVDEMEGSVSSEGPLDDSAHDHRVKKKEKCKPKRKANQSSGGERSDECDFVVVALPLGVLKERHAQSTVQWEPPLPPRKQEAFEKLGFGTENKIVLRFQEVFWDAEVPYLQTVDERFRILNGLCFGKGQTLVLHCSPPFGNGYNGLTEDRLVVAEALTCLKGMYGAAAVESSALVFSHVTRWDLDPFSMGAYSYWATGMALQHVLDAARPEPDPQLPRVRTNNEPLLVQQPSSEGFFGNYGVDGNSGSSGNGDGEKDCQHSSGAAVTPRLFFCGEHATIRDAQCVHGACNSGERAGRQVACAALGYLGDLKQCVAAGETYWYAPPPPLEPAEARCIGEMASSSASRQQLRGHENVLSDVPAEVPAPAAISELAPSAPVPAVAASPLKEALALSGRGLLLDPTYSPFPTPEAVAWYKSSTAASESNQSVGAGGGSKVEVVHGGDEDWLFACPCGVEGRGYDDGGAMVQCDDCESWQHQTCVTLYARTTDTKAAAGASAASTATSHSKGSSGQAGVCELCHTKHDGSYGSGRFCSQACRNRANGGKGGQGSHNKSSSPSMKRPASSSKAAAAVSELIHRCHRCDPKRFRGCPASLSSSHNVKHNGRLNNSKVASAFGVADRFSSPSSFPFSAPSATDGATDALSAAAMLPLRAAWEHSGLDAAEAAAAFVAEASDLAVQQAWARAHLRVKEESNASLLAISNKSEGHHDIPNSLTSHSDAHSSNHELLGSMPDSEVATALGLSNGNEVSSRGKSIESLKSSLPKRNGSQSPASHGTSKTSAARAVELTWADVEWGVPGSAMTDESAADSSEGEAETDGSFRDGYKHSNGPESNLKEPVSVRSQEVEPSLEGKLDEEGRSEAEPRIVLGSQSNGDSEHADYESLAVSHHGIGDGHGQAANNNDNEDGASEVVEEGDDADERDLVDASDNDMGSMPGEGPAEWAGLLGAFSATQVLLSDAAQSVMAAGWQSALDLAAARKHNESTATTPSFSSSSSSSSCTPGSSLRRGSTPGNSTSSDRMKVSLQRQSWPPQQPASTVAAPALDHPPKPIPFYNEAYGYAGAAARYDRYSAQRTSETLMPVQTFAPAKPAALPVNRSAFLAPFRSPPQGQISDGEKYRRWSSSRDNGCQQPTRQLNAEQSSKGRELGASAAVWSSDEHGHWHLNGSHDFRNTNNNFYEKNGSPSSHSISRTSGVGNIDSSSSSSVRSSNSLGSGLTDTCGSYDHMESQWMSNSAVSHSNYSSHSYFPGSSIPMCAGGSAGFTEGSVEHRAFRQDGSQYHAPLKPPLARPPFAPFEALLAEPSTVPAPLLSSIEPNAAPPAARPPAESFAALPAVLSAAPVQKPPPDGLSVEPLALTSLSQNHWAAPLV